MAHPAMMVRNLDPLGRAAQDLHPDPIRQGDDPLSRLGSVVADDGCSDWATRGLPPHACGSTVTR
jgi:hypothetical protein